MNKHLKKFLSDESGFALVKGPLFSIEARGKIADAMVHFPWKGRNVVRKWLKPANPRDIDQKIIRQKLSAAGKNTWAVSTPTAVLADGSAMYKMIKAKTPADNIWNAFFAKSIVNSVKNEADMTAAMSALAGTIAQTNWRCCALELGLSDITGDMYATTITPELQLFLGALAAYNLALSDATNAYSTYPSNWLAAVISQFATDYTQIY